MARTINYERPPFKVLKQHWNQSQSVSEALTRLANNGHSLTKNQLNSVIQYYRRESPDWDAALKKFPRGGKKRKKGQFPERELFVELWNTAETSAELVTLLERKCYPMSAQQVSVYARKLREDDPDNADELPPFNRGPGARGHVKKTEDGQTVSTNLEKERSTLRSHLQVMDMTGRAFDMSPEAKIRELGTMRKFLMRDYTRPELHAMIEAEYHRQCDAAES